MHAQNALLFMDGLQSGQRVERWRWKNTGLEVGQGSQGAHHAAEAVVERVGNADDGALEMEKNQ
jgi:hypothetical protein